MSASMIHCTIWSAIFLLLSGITAQENSLSGDFRVKREIFFLNLEDGYFGCQVNDSIDVLKLFELSKLCDGTPQCFMGSDELHKDLKCTDDCTLKTGKRCQNGVCLGSQCHCNDGFGGKGCEMPDENECKLRPCDIFSHCTNSMGSYFCTCFPGYEGDGYKCTDIDECLIPELRSLCVPYAECCNLPGHFACKCLPGYKGDGKVKCVDENECEDGNPCGENSICYNTPGSYNCACNPGYIQDGTYIANKVEVARCVPVCSKTVCSANAECLSVDGRPVCACIEGFTGTPGTRDGCHPIVTDKCKTHADCSENQICMDHVEGKTCESACNSIHCGPNTICVAKNHIGHCQSPCDPVNCGPHARCNAEGVEAYCVCEEGWSYDPKNITAGCIVMNATSLQECNIADGNDGSCGEHSVCTGAKGIYSCTCTNGFTGNPRLGCTDINECLHPNTCGEHAECLNLLGKFECACPSGTVADPDPKIRCTKIIKCKRDDECPGNAFCDSFQHVCLCPEPNFGEDCRHPCEFHRCSENTECMLINGKSTCVCSTGYAGLATSSIGCSDVDECLSSPCGNNGLCENIPGSYLCKTAHVANTTKPYCSSDIDCSGALKCDRGQCVKCLPGYHDVSGTGECVSFCDGVLCGQNAHCVVTPIGSTCECSKGFDGNPFPGGRCDSSVCSPFNPCQPTSICELGRCKERCGSLTCGVRAECNEHTGQCACPVHHVGNPEIQCDPPIWQPSCTPACGTNAHCEIGEPNKCICNSGSTGNPYEVCGAQDRTCVDSNCGENAECWESSCRCKAEFPSGNPFKQCFKAPESLVDCSRGECKCVTAQTCPTGLSCVNGICADLCTGVSCGSNELCSYGLCTTKNCIPGSGNHVDAGCEFQSCESDKSCSSTDICFSEIGKPRVCVDGCSKMHCGPNAVCTTDQHRSSCSCIPNNFGDPTNLAIGCQPFAVVDHECSSSVDCTQFDKGICETDMDGFRRCVNPCQNLVCTDPNQVCQNVNGRAACRCADGFSVSKETSLCEKQRKANCRGDSDCNSTHICVPDELQVMRCAHICTSVICSANAECFPAQGKPVCGCKEGFTGNPVGRDGCHAVVLDKCQNHEECSENQICSDRQGGRECEAVCNSVRCGPQAVCVSKNHVGECQCLEGKYKGDPSDPNTGCIPVPCVFNSDCNSTQTCNRLENQCTDVCDPNSCGENAICIAENHNYRCLCPVGFISLNPDTGCLPLSTCNNNTCHPSAVCEPTLNGFECKCNIGHIGEPYTSGCKDPHSSCDTHTDCSEHAICSNGKCLNSCENSCGANSICNVVNHKAECSCQPGFALKRTENGISCMREVVGCEADQDCRESICVGKECKSICRSAEDCAAGERCVYNMCMLPCLGSLQCPVGQTCAGGFCILGCRNNKECPKEEACIDHQCRDPCAAEGVCGPNSLCRPISHSPQCFCPEGFNTSPTAGCTRKNVQCSATVECAAGSICLGGSCSISCDKDMSCAAGEQCRNNICVRVCYTDSNCQPGEICIEGVCSLGCRSDSDCITTETCVSSLCRCGTGYVSGSTGCRDINECDANPCHPTAQCFNTPGSYRCSCPETLVGEDPEKLGCHASRECNTSIDCANNLECVGTGNSEYKCLDPCAAGLGNSGKCGLNAQCSVVDHTARCGCPENYIGDPYGDGCHPAECTMDSDCTEEEKCSLESRKCVNPCNELSCDNGLCSTIAHRATCTEACSNQGYTLENGVCQDVNECMALPCHPTGICKNYGGGFSCNCPEGKVGEPEINGAGCEDPDTCFINSDCPTSAVCKKGKCKDACEGSCGKNAECLTSNHTHTCSCPARYKGDPFHECIEWNCEEAVDCPSKQTCYKNECIDPCTVEHVCGQNTECTVINHSSVCTCSPSFTGDPVLGCQRIKNCSSESSCPIATACVSGTCVPRCSSTRDCLPAQKCLEGICHAVCLRSSDCLESQICEDETCKSAGGCRSNSDCSFDQFCSETSSGQRQCQTVCNNLKVVCGIHETCVAKEHEGICECLIGYTGTPPSCHPECSADSQCSGNQVCLQSACSDPCPPQGCGLNSHCSVVNLEKTCVCNDGFLNDTRFGCLANECNGDADCPEDKKCNEAKCMVACDLANACPKNSICLSTNHQQKCQCQDGYTASTSENGILEDCKPECSANSDCSGNKFCLQNKCSEICPPGACGFNANCHIVNHEITCECPHGFTGMAALECVRIAVPCRSTEECSKSQFCSEDGICLFRCGSDNECAANERCGNGSCMLTCNLDNDCFLSHICLNNTCTIGCRSNDDCSGEESCQRQKCSRMCTADTCGLNSLCNVVNHTSHCSCPLGMIPNPTALVGCVRQPVICTDNSNCGSSFTCQRNICKKMCGSNTDCLKNEICDNEVCTHVCRKDSECKEGEICNGLTCMEGCRSDNDCKKTENCMNKSKCVNPCASGTACGINAICSVENHQTKCRCSKPLVGDPHLGCTLPKLSCDVQKPCPEGLECLDDQCRFTCSSNNQCLSDEQCLGGVCKTLCSRDDQCESGSICQGRICLGGCRSHSHCPTNQTCVNRICRDPCKGNLACGDCALCSVVNHRVQCQCPLGSFGMPTHSCRTSPKRCSALEACSSGETCENGYCLQSCQAECLCGQVCELGYCRNKCTRDDECAKEQLCHSGYCRAGCKANSDCLQQNACINGQCADPCESGKCGVNAVCKASQHEVKCLCPNGLPEGSIGCTKNTTCTADSQCNKVQSCFQGNCINPCLEPGACGLNSQCKVVNRKPLCLCPTGWTGSPLTECINEELDCRLNPHRKECESDRFSSCDNLICGKNALCKFKKNVARCVCQDAFPLGDPNIECHSSPDRSDDCRVRDCGKGASCNNVSGTFTCECPVGTLGNPEISCTEVKCRSSADCSHSLICAQNICIDPCKLQNPCNGSQVCEVKDHFINCKERLTSISCTQNEQCPNDKYCYRGDGTCRNPCSLTTCGHNAYCVADKHASKCVCLEGTEFEGGCIRRFRTDFPRPEMTVNCLADGVQVDILIGPFEAETKNTSEFNGLLYVKGHSKDPQCRKSVQPHLENVDFKVNFGTCGLLHNDGEAGFILVIQKHPRLVTYNAQAYDIKCIYMTGEKTITLGFNVSMLTTAGTIANTGPPPTCSMRIATAAGGEISSAEIGESLVLRVDVQPSSIYGGFVRNCVAKTMEGDGENEYPVTDENGCASDPTVFGDWEVESDTQILIAHFNAFKFPTSSSIKFQCNVRVCFGKCQPVNCGSQDAFGRRKRNALREDVPSLLSIGFEGQLREEVRIESNPILAIERREDHLSNPTEEPRISKEEVCISTNGFVISLIITAFLSLVAVAVAVSCWLMAYKRRNRSQGPLPHPQEFPNPLFTVAELIAEPSPDYIS